MIGISINFENIFLQFLHIEIVGMTRRGTARQCVSREELASHVYFPFVIKIENIGRKVPGDGVMATTQTHITQKLGTMLLATSSQQQMHTAISYQRTSYVYT